MDRGGQINVVRSRSLFRNYRDHFWSVLLLRLSWLALVVFSSLNHKYLPLVQLVGINFFSLAVASRVDGIYLTTNAIWRRWAVVTVHWCNHTGTFRLW